MVIAFIPARGGSKSIPLKNIKNICGRPLIYWSLLALENSNNIDTIVLATDSDEIKRIAESFHFSKLLIYDRDPVNAEDNASTESVMMEFIEKNSYQENDLFILVQATSPFTTTEDFDKALNQFKQNAYDSLLSVVENKRFFWNKEGKPTNYDYLNRPRRQDFAGQFMENGAFYINKISGIQKDKNRLNGRIGIYIMPEYTGFEIDEPDDWIICEMLMKKYCKNSAITDIRVFMTDVDGVMTDAGMYYSESGDEMKKFNTLDGMGIELLRKAGIKTAIITSENTAIVKRRAEKLKIDYLYQGVKDKLSIAHEICKKENISLAQISYIGDDKNDIELLTAAGIAACPKNAVPEVKMIANIRHLHSNGGDGAIREFAEILLKASVIVTN